jgi:hypothetical protein
MISRVEYLLILPRLLWKKKYYDFIRSVHSYSIDYLATESKESFGTTWSILRVSKIHITRYTRIGASALLRKLSRSERILNDLNFGFLKVLLIAN